MSQLDIILDKALSLKGSHEYDNYCQKFVRVCYEAAGITGSAASANEAYSKWAVSKDIDSVPAGAAVYFKGIGAYGHVGIATGNGNVIHAANGVRVQSLDYCDKRYVFKGWGWQGGVRPDGASGKMPSDTGTDKSTSQKGRSAAGSKTIENISLKNLGSGRMDSVFGKIDSIGEVDKGYELLIENDRVYLPAVTGELYLEYKRQLAPASLKFSVLKDSELDFAEGSPVRLRVGGRDVFRGYVFEKSRRERDIINVTAYDSLRYFKNKDTILYRGKRYSDLLKMLISDYRLKAGDICDTGYVIEKQLEEGTVFDILANAADITYLQTGRRYVLLDDFGRICLRNTDDMETGIVLNKDNIGSFDYTSTIDRQVYDHISIVSDDKTEGIRNIYTLSDDNTAVWGELRYMIKPAEELDKARIRELAQAALKKYSRKRRYLTLHDVKGDISARGGSVVKTELDLGDIVLNEKMVCERVRHTFFGTHHLMDIDMFGREGEFDV